MLKVPLQEGTPKASLDAQKFFFLICVTHSCSRQPFSSCGLCCSEKYYASVGTFGDVGGGGVRVDKFSGWASLERTWVGARPERAIFK